MKQGKAGAWLCGVALFTLASTAAAQDPAAADRATDSPDEQQTSGNVSDPAENEIVITARRRSETTLTAPVSVTALTGQSLADAGVRRLEELAIRVPNFRQSTGGPNNFNFIRGIGSGSNAGFEQAVGVFVDEVYFGRGNQAHLPFFDMQQVEVLRGPQVLFFGNSTTAGAISFTTRRPGSEFAVNADASYEFNNREMVLNAGVDLPVNEQLALRFSAFHQDLDRGWLQSVVNGGETTEPRYTNTGVRAMVDYAPADTVELMFKAEYLDMRQLGNVLQPVTNLLNNPAIVETRFDQRRVVGRPAPFSGQGDVRNLEQQNYLLRGAIDIGSAELIATTGYVDYSFDQTIEADLTPQPIIDYRQNERYRQFSQEIRLAGSITDNLDYVIGGYFQRDTLGIDIFIEANVPPARFTGGRRARLDQRSTTASAFANFTLRPVEGLEITAGARYSNVRKRADQSTVPVNVVTGVPNPALEGPVYRSLFGITHAFTGLRQRQNAFMPQASIQYSVSPSAMLFARFVKGEKSGGFDPLYADSNPALASFRPETATSYEGGFKGSFANNAVTLALTGFYTDLDDLQVSTFNGSTNYVVGNAARARSKGFELEATWRPVSQLLISAVAGYTDFRYLSFTGAGCTSQQNVARPVGCSQDLSGRTGPFVSKFTGTLNAAWRQPVGRHELEISTAYSYRSSYNPSPSLDPLLQQDGFGLLDARLEFRSADGWRVGIFGRNLTNELFAEAGADVPGIRGATYLTTSRRRQVGIQAGVDF